MTAPRERLDERIMVRLARLLTRVFFRDIEVSGAEHLPAEGPVVLVANHVNGLVDALVLMAVLRRYPRFLAKDTLFKIVPLIPFLRMARVIPVHRAKDGGSGGDRNASAFRSCRQILGAGGIVALFPEGISHDEPNLQELRSGAARIALEAGIDDGAPVVTVATGLVYDNKARFRSRALVRVGPVETVDRYRHGSGETSDGRDSVRDLTDDLATRLRAVGPDFDSWEDTHRWSAVADVVTGEDRELTDRDAVARRLAQAAASRPDDPRFGQLTDAATAYTQELALLGLDDDDDLQAVVAPTDSSRPAPDRALRRAATSAVIASPVVAVGTAVHVLPYAVMKRLGRLPKNEGMKATVKVLGCFALFSIVYVTLGIVVGRRVGFLAGLAAFLAGPLSGYVTLRTAERINDAGGLARAARVVRGHDLGSLLAARAAVVDLAQVLLAEPLDVGDVDDITRPAVLA